jgi:chromosome segregation ATPase
MKKRIVLWGENTSNEKVLIGLELLERDNKVMIYTFPLEVATESFYQSMLDQWREGKPLDFPQPHQVIERPLSISDSILPENLKVERTDLISRAQAEWQVVVLSSKLYDMYKEELDDIKGKIDQLSEYDDKLWEEAKSFWGKVQEQVKEQTLFREHSAILKERTNNLFEKLKELKKAVQGEFEKTSKLAAESFFAEIKEIQEKVDKGLGLKPLFEQMKAVQEKYYKAQLTKEDRKSVWDQLDGTFKSMKERKPQGNGGGQRDENKLKARYDGLIDTIGKMEKSIQRDRQDLDFQVKKIEQTDGQLEMQIRQAKLKMLEERISSKDEKLQDMYKVKVELESKMAKEESRKVNEEKKYEAKEAAKKKIASNIEANIEERETIADLLESAASKIKESKDKKTPKKESLLSAITETLSETFEDAVDTIKAVAEVVSDKVEDVADEIESKVEVVVDDLENKVEDAIDAVRNNKEDEDITSGDKTKED